MNNPAFTAEGLIPRKNTTASKDYITKQDTGRDAAYCTQPDFFLFSFQSKYDTCSFFFNSL